MLLSGHELLDFVWEYRWPAIVRFQYKRYYTAQSKESLSPDSLTGNSRVLLRDKEILFPMDNLVQALISRALDVELVPYL